jgi:integrase
VSAASAAAGAGVTAGTPRLPSAGILLAPALDPGFLSAAGWDPAGHVLAPPASHPLLRDGSGPGPEAAAASPGGDCAARGCPRQVTAAGRELCREHRRRQRISGDLPLELFLASPPAGPLTATGPCHVRSCPRDRTSRTRYCEAHQYQLRTARDAAGGTLDEEQWRTVTSPVPVRGQVSFRGLPAQLAAELLFGLQQRTMDGLSTRLHVLRALVEDLRRAGAVCLNPGWQASGPMAREKGQIGRSLARYVRAAAGDTAGEMAKDVWDLIVFGSPGRLTFTGITQYWLRESVKRWAADELPRHRGQRPHVSLRHTIAAVARLSAHLHAARDDHGRQPSALSRADIESFLHHLAYLESAGQLSRDLRVRICQDTRRILSRIRALGLTMAGEPAAALADRFTLSAGDVPRAAERPEPCRDLPAEIMRALTARLDDLVRGSCGTEIRTGIELLMDTGRRPAEIAALGFDCLTRDSDGSPVLIYDNRKSARDGRRLPVSETTATVIIGQQQRVRDRFPAASPAALALLPTVIGNPDGARPISTESLIQRHRDWIGRMPPFALADGREFDRAKIVPYSYRHTYAQRHADAGVAPDVLRDLMNHRNMTATLGYYRIGEDRRREAVDRVAAMQFDRHGNRIWRDVRELLDTEHARYAISEVAVPYGRCAEPSNVAAGGGACPIRFRCAGCDHFRTDVSYLPDLTAYLDDLLRTRERLAAAIGGVDEWARADATPAQEEITRIRRLINQIKGDLAGLGGTESTAIDEAITVLRRHRAVNLAMPAVRPGAAPRTPAIKGAS